VVLDNQSQPEGELDKTKTTPAKD